MKLMLFKILIIGLFGVAVLLGLAGILFALDAFIPKERSISNWGVFGEFLFGVTLLGFAYFLESRNLLFPKGK
jgi:hypothetical protein